MFATGPRATPTVDGDRVYILGAAGMLSCFDTAGGDLIWRIDSVADYDVTVPVYGVAHSPLVEGEHLITLLGGEPDAMVVAFDKATGAEAWARARYELGSGLLLADRDHRRGVRQFDRLAPRPGSRRSTRPPAACGGSTTFRSRAG